MIQSHWTRLVPVWAITPLDMQSMISLVDLEAGKILHPSWYRGTFSCAIYVSMRTIHTGPRWGSRCIPLSWSWYRFAFMTYLHRTSMESGLGQGMEEMANCILPWHFHTIVGMGSGPGLGPMAYQDIFVGFLVPLKVHCKYPVLGPSSTLTVSEKTSAYWPRPQSQSCWSSVWISHEYGAVWMSHVSPAYSPTANDFENPTDLS